MRIVHGRDTHLGCSLAVDILGRFAVVLDHYSNYEAVKFVAEVWTSGLRLLLAAPCWDGGELVHESRDQASARKICPAPQCYCLCRWLLDIVFISVQKKTGPNWDTQSPSGTTQDKESDHLLINIEVYLLSSQTLSIVCQHGESRADKQHVWCRRPVLYVHIGFAGHQNLLRSVLHGCPWRLVSWTGELW